MPPTRWRHNNCICHVLILLLDIFWKFLLCPSFTGQTIVHMLWYVYSCWVLVLVMFTAVVSSLVAIVSTQSAGGPAAGREAATERCVQWCGCRGEADACWQPWDAHFALAYSHVCSVSRVFTASSLHFWCNVHVACHSYAICMTFACPPVTLVDCDHLFSVRLDGSRHMTG